MSTDPDVLGKELLVGSPFEYWRVDECPLPEWTRDHFSVEQLTRLASKHLWVELLHHDGDMRLRERAVAAALTHWMFGTTKAYAWPAVPLIARRAGCSPNTARAGLHRLAGMGWLRVRARLCSGGQTSSVYALDVPEPVHALCDCTSREWTTFAQWWDDRKKGDRTLRRADTVADDDDPW